MNICNDKYIRGFSLREDGREGGRVGGKDGWKEEKREGIEMGGGRDRER